MKLSKKILLLLLLLFIAVQFIQPEQNSSVQPSVSDIAMIYHVPDKVLALLKTACYDCHSNNTAYPWYSHIQPGAWLMSNHIKQGKENLNFSEYGAYSHRKQVSKLRAIDSSINDGSMPLWSYTLLHTNAKLSKDEQALITGWVRKTKDSLTAKR